MESVAAALRSVEGEASGVIGAFSTPVWVSLTILSLESGVSRVLVSLVVAPNTLGPAMPLRIGSWRASEVGLCPGGW